MVSQLVPVSRRGNSNLLPLLKVRLLPELFLRTVEGEQCQNLVVGWGGLLPLKSIWSLMEHPQVPTCRVPKQWTDDKRERWLIVTFSLHAVSSLNHKQVFVLLSFLSILFAFPSSCFCEAWEPWSKHRSYDSAWPQLRGAGGDGAC